MSDQFKIIELKIRRAKQAPEFKTHQLQMLPHTVGWAVMPNINLLNCWAQLSNLHATRYHRISRHASPKASTISVPP